MTGHGSVPRHFRSSSPSLLLGFAKPAELQAEAYAELIDMLYATFVPVVVMGVALGIVGAVASERAQDRWAFLAAAGLVINALRACLIFAFRHRRSKTNIPVFELRLWERCYAAGSYVFSVVLGLFNYSVAASEHSLTLMLSVGLIFAYGAGMISRVYARPKICMISISLAAVPTIAGFAAKSFEGGNDALVFGGQALFIFLFFVSSFEMVLFSYRAITTQLGEKQDFAKLARFDDLTKLPNRLGLSEHFRTNVEAALDHGRMLFLHYLDLDGFKSVNDQYGHPTGDALIRAVAERLSTSMREGDLVARIGGDEFVVVQAGQRMISEAEFLARRLVRALGAPYVVQGKTIVIGVSIGIAVFPQDGLTLELLSARADQALYIAKRGGRGQVAFWSPPERLSGTIGATSS